MLAMIESMSNLMLFERMVQEWFNKPTDLWKWSCWPLGPAVRPRDPIDLSLRPRPQPRWPRSPRPARPRRRSRFRSQTDPSKERSRTREKHSLMKLICCWLIGTWLVGKLSLLFEKNIRLWKWKSMLKFEFLWPLGSSNWELPGLSLSLKSQYIITITIDKFYQYAIRSTGKWSKVLIWCLVAILIILPVPRLWQYKKELWL